VRIKIVKIGNSKGIRIPKVFLRQTGINEEVNIQVKRNQIILEPINDVPRAGWDAAFTNMAKLGDDQIFDFDEIINQSSFDETEWEW
jgi:antitoxin MazE